MKSTELFVEQTLTGFLVLSAAAAPFIAIETLPKLAEDAKGGIDIGSAAGAIGAAYLLGVVFDRFADTLLERLNRWNRLLFAIDLMKDGKALSPDDPFPEDRLQIEVIREGNPAWEWMDYLRSRIRIARAMTAFVPALTLSLMLAAGLHGRDTDINIALSVIVAAYLIAFLASRFLERFKSRQRLPKTYELKDKAGCERACEMMRTATEPVAWLAAVLIGIGILLIMVGNDPGWGAMAAILAAGITVTGLSAWTWWRTTLTFMQFLHDYKKWGEEKAAKNN